MQRRWMATTPVPAPQQAHHSGRDRCRRSAQGAERIEGIEGIAEAPSGSCSARPLHLDPRPAEHFNPAGPPSVAPAPQLASVGVGNPAGVAGRQVGIVGHQPAAAAVREPARLRVGRRLVPLGRRGGAGGHAPTLTAPGHRARQRPESCAQANHARQRPPQPGWRPSARAAAAQVRGAGWRGPLAVRARRAGQTVSPDANATPAPNSEPPSPPETRAASAVGPNPNGASPITSSNGSTAVPPNKTTSYCFATPATTATGQSNTTPTPTAPTSNPPGSNPPNHPKDGEFRASSILGVEN